MKEYVSMSEMANLYVLDLQKYEKCAQIPADGSTQAFVILTLFCDFIESSSASERSLQNITDSELASFYLELKKMGERRINIVMDLKIVVRFLSFLERSGFFSDSEATLPMGCQ